MVTAAIAVVVTLLVAGLVVLLIDAVPIDARIKSVARAVVIFVAVILVLGAVLRLCGYSLPDSMSR